MPQPNLAMTRACAVRAYAEGCALLACHCDHGEGVLVPGGALVISGETVAGLNIALIYGPGHVEATVELFVRRLRERSLPGTIYARPDAAGRVEALAEHLGLRPDEPCPVMLCDAPTLRSVEASVTVARVTTEAEVDEVARVQADAFEAPAAQWRSVIGSYLTTCSCSDIWMSRIDGEAAAAMQTVVVGSVVGLLAMGTRPSLRRRGAATAVLGAAMRYHLDRGAQTFVLAATEAAMPLYRAFGFEPLESHECWLVDAVGAEPS